MIWLGRCTWQAIWYLLPFLNFGCFFIGLNINFGQSPLIWYIKELREAPFWNVLVLYGHCPNSLSPPPPPCQTGKCGKKVSQTILASPYTLRQRGEKVPQTILASFYTLPLMGNAHMKSTHFKKGLPSLIHNILQISLFCLCFCSLCSLVYIF